MIIVMRQDATAAQQESVIRQLSDDGLTAHKIQGSLTSVFGAVGDTANADYDKIAMMPGVEKVLHVQEPYKMANRKFHPDNTALSVGGAKIGGGGLAVIAGPCSVESEEQMNNVAASVKRSGATFLRGGAFKPRTSPYSFQGLEKQGLELLQAAGRANGMPIVTEIMNPRHVEMFEMVVDVIQIGARNMQNFDLLKEVGATKKPILLKRGLSSTVDEWLMSAEYIMSRGNLNVILCERGIRTFETITRNTLDLSAVPAVKKLSHLPVIVDPSHASGRADLVLPLALAAVAVGADGLMIEVHPDPSRALCDGAQSLNPEQFDELMKKVSAIAGLMRPDKEEIA